MDSTYAESDPAKRPADIFRQQDPARFMPGAPPNFGLEVVPQVATVAGQTGLAGHAYLNADEALRHSIDNAARMRVDCGVMECLEARQRASALLNWHIEPEDEKSADQKQLCAELTKIVERSPFFMEWRHSMMQAVWYGRYATANQFCAKRVCGRWRTVLKRWEPRNGDKLVFRYDDGSGKYEADQVGIRVGTMALTGRTALNRRQIEYTQNGTVYWLNDYERKLISIHKHTREDGDYEDVYSSSRIHGVGIRSRIYWTWYAMVECMQRALEFLDRSAFGIQLWGYPANNPNAKTAVENAATKNVGGGRSIILVPKWPGDEADQYGVELIEPGLQGFDRLLQVIKEYFGHKIKRYILGQTLTSEADATGLGSGVADAHLATFADIVAYDSRNLEESITEEYLRHLQLWNFPKSEGIWLRFVIDTESPNVEARLKALKNVWDMGMGIKESDLADAAGIAVPSIDDKVVFNPQVYMAIKQAGAQMNAAATGSSIQPSSPQQLEALLRQAVMQNQKPLSIADMESHVMQHMVENEELRLSV